MKDFLKNCTAKYLVENLNGLLDDLFEFWINVPT